VDNARACLRRQYPDMVALADDEAAYEYGAAVHAFATAGDRGAFMRRLLALGLTAAEIRWHLAHRGERFCAVCPGEASLGHA
jgi:hypothetical protein